MQDLDALIPRLAKREIRAIARAISLAETPGRARLELLHRLFPYSGSAFKIGITGAPGAGKSTLTTHLLSKLQAAGRKPAALAVDPTSPFSGGAILGDRIRMQAATELEGVYVRSMASRGSLGGLSRGVAGAIRVLEAAGFDAIVIETVGSGQLQVDVRYVADVVALTLVPEAGDVIQAMKAGIIEIADIYVINKADREGAQRMKTDLRSALELGGRSMEWVPPIVLTNGLTGDGLDDLFGFIQERQEALSNDGLTERRKEQLEWELRVLAVEAMESQAKTALKELFEPSAIEQVLTKQRDPFVELMQLWDGRKPSI